MSLPQKLNRPALLSDLQQLGRNIHMIRRRRNIQVEQVAQEAGISRGTCWAIEKGSPTVSIGAYQSTLAVLGFAEDLKMVASCDDLGRKLEIIGIPVRKRIRHRR